MQWLFKIGNKKPVVTLEDRLKYWTDGQLVDIRESGCYKPMKGFLILEDGQDFWKVRGDTDWKSTKESVYELKKLLYVPDALGKYPWDYGYNEETKLQMVRNRFIDYKRLLDAALITRSEFDAIYNKSQSVLLNVSFDIKSRLLTELTDLRLLNEYSDITASIAQDGAGSGTGGGFTIGAAGDYATPNAFEADLAATLTGDLHGLHLNEQTTTGAAITFDLDTNGHTLYLTAETGCAHNGGAYGNGARISFGAADGIFVDETNDGDLDDFEISKLAFLGANNLSCILISDAGNSGGITVNRCLFDGNGSTNIKGVTVGASGNNVTITNNIAYDCDSIGYSLNTADRVYAVYNNSSIKNGVGFFQDHPTVSTNLIFKNNLAQDNTTDYSNDGGGWGTHAYNVSEDATSPDAAYQSKDVHTNSVFEDYGGDDYRLDPDGDATNLQILDDGEDLSGTFADDIAGQTRSTWYIGASEIVVGTTTTTMYPTTTTTPEATTTTTTPEATTTTTTPEATTTTTTPPPSIAPTSIFYGPLVGPLGGPL